MVVAVTIGAVVALGTSVGNVFGKVLDKLPTHDQKVMKEFFKFLDRYNEEIVREDMDHDDLLVWKERKDTLIETVIEQLRNYK